MDFLDLFFHCVSYFSHFLLRNFFHWIKKEVMFFPAILHAIELFPQFVLHVDCFLFVYS